MNVTIKYYNNVVREVVGELEYQPDSIDLFWKSTIRMLWERNHLYDSTKGRFYLLRADGNLLQIKPFMPLEDEKEVIYSESTIPYNAYRFIKCDGIDYIFHTDERNHLYDPHVHATYNGKDISISLKSLKTYGTLDNRSKENIAKKYVKDNKDDLLKMWNELHHI